MSDMFSRARMNMDLSEKEQGTYLSKGERKALKRAEKAEREFRVSKGYEAEGFFRRLMKHFKK